MRSTLNLKDAKLEPLSDLELMQIDGGDVDGLMRAPQLDLGRLERFCQNVSSGAKKVWDWWSSLERRGSHP